MTTPDMSLRELAEKASSWRYSINYGPDGEENWANLITPEGDHVANIRSHHARRIVALLDENERLREALGPFVIGDAATEQILWGHLPDEATGTVTVKLGDFRAARSALHPTPEVKL